MTALLARYRGTIAAIVNGIAGVLVGPTTITTSTTASTATAYSNQRKIDRCQNGVLWSFHVVNGIYIDGYYSTDNGATWTYGSRAYQYSGSLGSHTVNHSIFIDLDDYAHIVYKDNNDGYIYYRRGTPNAGRTAWTWSSATGVYTSGTAADYPDVIAHREGTGWTTHVVTSFSNGSDNYGTYYRIPISSGGVVGTPVGSNLNAVGHGNANHTWPSIDFHHTGDGKTVAGSTPHLYAAWSAGATGAGKGIRFKKATYSGGAWTWGTEREIDSTRYVLGSNNWLLCMFDGTRVVIPAYLYDGGGGTNPGETMLYERDAGDTTTTERILVDYTVGNTQFLSHGSATYDGDGNVYLFGANQDEAVGSRDLVYRKWTRVTTTLSSEVVIDSGVDSPWVSAKRGHSNSRIEFVYTDGTSSPYNVVYGGIE